MRLLSIIGILLLTAPLFTFAQDKKIKPYKPPQLFSSLGSYTGKKTADVEDAKKVILLPLIIHDSAGNMYTISSYQFLYRYRTKYEDEVTGEVKQSFATSAQLFKATPLPSVWTNHISEDLKSGEELYFFDIIVKDAKGRAMYAPDLSITIK
jgi:hypothetical protein